MLLYKTLIQVRKLVLTRLRQTRSGGYFLSLKITNRETLGLKVGYHIMKYLQSNKKLFWTRKSWIEIWH